MRGFLPFKLAAVAVLSVGVVAALGFPEDKAEMADNPMYKGWVAFKAGSGIVVDEKTELGDGSTEEKTINYTLIRAGKSGVIVRTVVIEKDVLSIIESAPTRITYPAKLRKADLDAFLDKADLEGTKTTLKVGGKEMDCSKVEISRKTKGEQIQSTLWRSTEVPGGILKRIRTVKTMDGKLIATTTTVVKSFTIGDGLLKTKAKEAAKKD